MEENEKVLRNTEQEKVNQQKKERKFPTTRFILVIIELLIIAAFLIVRFDYVFFNLGGTLLDGTIVFSNVDDTGNVVPYIVDPLFKEGAMALTLFYNIIPSLGEFGRLIMVGVAHYIEFINSFFINGYLPIEHAKLIEIVILSVLTLLIVIFTCVIGGAIARAKRKKKEKRLTTDVAEICENKECNVVSENKEETLEKIDSEDKEEITNSEMPIQELVNESNEELKEESQTEKVVEEQATILEEPQTQIEETEKTVLDEDKEKEKQEVQPEIKEEEKQEVQLEERTEEKVEKAEKVEQKTEAPVKRTYTKRSAMIKTPVTRSSTKSKSTKEKSSSKNEINKKEKNDSAKESQTQTQIEEQKKEVVDNKTNKETTPKKTGPRKNYHVSLRASDGKWQVKFANGQKAIKLFDTQAQAIEFAKALAESQEGLITIHKVDGKIRKQDYSKK